MPAVLPQFRDDAILGADLVEDLCNEARIQRIVRFKSLSADQRLTSEQMERNILSSKWVPIHVQS
jgi:hypothetical protein